MPCLDGVYSAFGVLATLQQVGRLPSAGFVAIVRATGRVRIGTGIPGAGAALWVEATTVDDSLPTDRPRAGRRVQEARHLGAAESRQLADHRLRPAPDQPQRAGRSGRLRLTSTPGRSSSLLETPDVDTRLERLVEWVRAHIADMQVSEKIQNDVREGMEKSQREFLLRQQLAAIRRSWARMRRRRRLGPPCPRRAANLPEKVREAVFREIDRLEATSEQSLEGGWIRTWLDTVLELPWNVRTGDNDDVVAAWPCWMPTTTGWPTSRTG